MLENSEQSVRVVRMGKSRLLEHAELANQIQGFRIPDRWDASEKNKYGLLTKLVRSRWLDIGQVLFLRVYGPRQSRGP